jgi:predicted nucleic acid-binding protein
VNVVFADTSYYVALVNARDRHHLQAVDLLREGGRRLVTTDFVLVEVGNFLRRPPDRPSFQSLLANLLDDDVTSVIEASRSLIDGGLL